MDAIVVEGLSKTFKLRYRPEGQGRLRSFLKPSWREIQAVRGIDLRVAEGEVVAFLGPNGAGKSTTIKMLVGILSRTGGSARVLGLDPQARRTRLARSVGTVFGQKSQLWYHLPPSDSFELLGAVYEVPRAELALRRAELVERFGLGEFFDTPVRKLSLGQRVRCELAASLLHRPRLLFLDEPTIGLDVVARQEVRALLQELSRRDGTTVFLTSHDIGDIEKVCKRAIIVHHGTIVVDEDMKELKHRALSKKVIGVKYAEPVSVSLRGLEPIKRTPDALRYEVDTRAHNLQEVISTLVSAGEILDLTVEDEPLEDMIAEIYRSGSEEEAHAAAGKRPR